MTGNHLRSYSVQPGPIKRTHAPLVIELPGKKDEIANVLSSFLDSCKAYIPTFVKRVEELQNNVDEKSEHELTVEGMRLNNILERFLTKLAACIKDVKNKAPEVIICMDFIHTVKNRKNFLSAMEVFLADIRNPKAVWDDQIKARQLLETAFKDLIEELHGFENMNVDVKEETPLESLVPFIKTAFADLEIQMDAEQLAQRSIKCNGLIFKNIMNEIRENYKKYGQNGKLSLKAENNRLVIILRNNKKEKDEHAFSSSTGLGIINDYVKILGWKFTGNYKGETAKTTLILPLS